MTKLTSFSVTGLRGEVSLDIEIRDNTLIFVGENGSGKTTLLRMMFAFLSGKWKSLNAFHFETISAVVDDRLYKLRKSDVRRAFALDYDRVLRRLGPASRARIRDLVNNGQHEEADRYLSSAAMRYGLVSADISAEDLFSSDSKIIQALRKNEADLKSALDCQVLYLPTYRRIERELTSILGSEREEERQRQISRQQEDGDNYVELVEFGMKDVKKAIETVLENIRDFQRVGATNLTLSYLGDVVSEKYRRVDKGEIASASIETIDAVLNRVDDNILSSMNKDYLRDTLMQARLPGAMHSEHQLIVFHYFTRLLRFQRDLEVKEKGIREFCELCSSYIRDKIFLYDSATFSFVIKSKAHESFVELADLSSGEKQIVSLFSHLYLSGREKFLVLIDEPELSLSVPWQRRFLVDIASGEFTSGLIAATHSPFVYDNELKYYTRSIGEFLSGPDWGNVQ